MAADLGLTHVALPARDVDASAAFYATYAGMEVVHRRVTGPGAGSDAGSGDAAVAVVWLSDLTRPFVVVLLQTEVTHVLGGWAHLGVGCASRLEVDERVAAARAAGVRVQGPYDDGPPVGYWAILTDPDGHQLELAHGQEVGVTVARAGAGGPPVPEAGDR